MCDGKNHILKTIYRSEYKDHDEVVRWCEDCGAVVVDLEADNILLRAGGIMEMKFPKFSYRRT